MPAFSATMYANHPIQIPPEFPKILKQYTKAAIRTQPLDLLLWSASYFRCLANAEVPPVKDRLEYPHPETEFGLTPGILRVLHKQLGIQDTVNVTTMRAKWRGVCLPLGYLDEILKNAGCSTSNIPWRNVLVECALTLSQSLEPNVEAIMEILCVVMSDHPDGIATSLPDVLFVKMLRLVCVRLSVSQTLADEAEAYFTSMGKKQGGILTAQNFKAVGCPNL